ncbi:tRNA lysidine(34) synthetase TilS [Paracoccus pacificus]|uniref:tRNA(Ile)-lysidine synthase n=1 Tax=Paracoccus pacificus TaxID=1463598 RepID=A0ABW4R2X2_9RHOB
MTDLQDRLNAALDRLVPDGPGPIAVAYSGGGDSTALLHLTTRWAADRGRAVIAATVDHGLRAESADEAAAAGRAARKLGVGHTILRWTGGDSPGNLMANAREARLRLISDWARAAGAIAVVQGHTRDDQAETVLMRLTRGAGVDGLSGMAPARAVSGLLWLRPLLEIDRAGLRDWLTARGIGWADDPSNEKPEFERIRMRQAAAALTDLGITPVALTQVAENMAMARQALGFFATRAAGGAEVRNGDIMLPFQPLAEQPDEIRRRLIVAALRLVTGASYAPRRASVAGLMAGMREGGRATLDGVLITVDQHRIFFGREPEAARRAPPMQGEIWDNRWYIKGALAPGQTVAALGYDALAEIDWRGSGLSRDAAAASPAIWQNGALCAAPLLGKPGDWAVRPVRSLADFHALLISH